MLNAHCTSNSTDVSENVLKYVISITNINSYYFTVI